ncbi:Uncharacterized protein TCM_044488 [Theobroma cacao]|uniref:Uncharacterized protein n=1 Tax=Theobroma cacao TaxID=3641 RepID=A0A061FRU9_THECC|nr:Uncharacterized protein TCM_044488 [Theobroma cacao]
MALLLIVKQYFLRTRPQKSGDSMAVVTSREHRLVECVPMRPLLMESNYGLHIKGLPSSTNGISSKEMLPPLWICMGASVLSVEAVPDIQIGGSSTLQSPKKRKIIERKEKRVTKVIKQRRIMDEEVFNEGRILMEEREQFQGADLHSICFGISTDPYRPSVKDAVKICMDAGVKVVCWDCFVYANIQKFIQFQLTVNVDALVINVVVALSSSDVPLNLVRVQFFLCPSNVLTSVLI